MLCYYLLEQYGIKVLVKYLEPNFKIPNKIHFNMTPLLKETIQRYHDQNIFDIFKIKIYSLENFIYNKQKTLFRKRSES